MISQVKKNKIHVYIYVCLKIVLKKILYKNYDTFSVMFVHNNAAVPCSTDETDNEFIFCRFVFYYCLSFYFPSETLMQQFQ